MVIIRDEKRIERLSRWSKAISLFGIGALVVGFILAVMGFSEDSPVARYVGPQNVIVIQLAALGVGLICAQIGTYLAHRYVRSPRPDQVLDKALGRVAPNGRLYHYVLPVPHVLLSTMGVIILVDKYQGGQISVDEDRWKQKGVGMRRFFGQEGIGNPTKEAEQSVKILANFIHKNAPEVAELPIGALIVFTHVNQKALELGNTRIPAMHHTKVKSYLRRKRRAQPMPQETYNRLRAAFDQKATHFLEEPEGVEIES